MSITTSTPIGSIRTSKSRLCPRPQSPNIAEPPVATNPTKPGPAGDDRTLGPPACRTDSLADRRNDNHATPPTDGPTESPNSIPRRRRPVSCRHLVPQLLRSHDLDLRSPRQDPAPDLDRARDARPPQDCAVGLPGYLLRGMPRCLCHPRSDRSIETQDHVHLVLIGND